MTKPFIIHHSSFIIPSRRAFTLMELLIAIMILTLIAGLALSALAGATEMAREQRTRAIITKIDQLIMEKYESYRTRAVPIRIPPNVANANGKIIAARLRLYALRELMRMELPDRRTDIVFFGSNPPSLEPTVAGPPYVPVMQQSSLQKHYFRAAVRALGGKPSDSSTYGALNKWTQQFEGAECLYLILSAVQDGDKNALDYFDASEIGDIDGDGMKEILDGWGEPITFMRWAPGFVVQNEAATTQTADHTDAPDPFDPLKADPRWQDASQPIKPYALRPLIVSPGRDRELDIAAKLVVSGGGVDFRYTQTAIVNDPYYIPASGQVPFGTIGDINQDGEFQYADNITNHFLQTP